MDDLIKLVRTYRVTSGLAERLRLAEDIFRLIEPDLRLFVFSSVAPTSAEDVHQEILKAVATDLGRFQGGTQREFWAWCYRIARNKRNDHFRKSAADLLQPMPQEELWGLVEASTAVNPLSPADRHDLKYALDMLASAKPECRDYLWSHFIIGLDYADIAESESATYDAVRMKITRCLETAQALVS